jgi:hypothetical protein
MNKVTEWNGQQPQNNQISPLSLSMLPLAITFYKRHHAGWPDQKQFYENWKCAISERILDEVRTKYPFTEEDRKIMEKFDAWLLAWKMTLM